VPLGAIPNYSGYAEQEVTVEAGEIFLLYTDGLVEVRGESLDVGFDRLLDVMRGASSPQRLCHEIVGSLVPRKGARDDIAFVALQSAQPESSS
jgi:serine phosphatase RsbU (regulator of sigma subunit)